MTGLVNFDPLGPNAVRILRDLGTMEAIIARVNPEELRNTSFRFHYGMGDHEHIYTVRYMHSVPPKSLDTFLQYETTSEDIRISLHRWGIQRSYLCTAASYPEIQGDVSRRPHLAPRLQRSSL